MSNKALNNKNVVFYFHQVQVNVARSVCFICNIYSIYSIVNIQPTKICDRSQCYGRYGTSEIYKLSFVTWPKHQYLFIYTKY